MGYYNCYYYYIFFPNLFLLSSSTTMTSTKLPFNVPTFHEPDVSLRYFFTSTYFEAIIIRGGRGRPYCCPDSYRFPGGSDPLRTMPTFNKKAVAGGQCDQMWLGYLFNIWSFTTMKICQKAETISKVIANFCPMLNKHSNNCQRL